jgi:hypothetical protein
MNVRLTGGGVSNALAWDAENKLSRVTVGALAFDHVHDANHARVMKVVPQAGLPAKVTVYLGGTVHRDPTRSGRSRNCGCKRYCR